MHTQLNVTRHNEDFGLARTKQQFDTCPDVITTHLHRHTVYHCFQHEHTQQTDSIYMYVNK